LKAIVSIYCLQLLFTILSPSNHWLLYINPILRLGDYYIGILLGIIVVQKKYKTQNEYIEIVTLCVFILIYIYSNKLEISFRYDVLFLPIFSLVIYVFSTNSSKINKIFSSDILVSAGNKTFEFYMIHVIVINRITHIIDNDRVVFIILLSFLTSLIMSFLLNKINVRILMISKKLIK
jgi:peptidoglycan/LPS O-acetylase OafA/YrhL